MSVEKRTLGKYRPLAEDWCRLQTVCMCNTGLSVSVPQSSVVFVCKLQAVVRLDKVRCSLSVQRMVMFI
jgi:hypothetical protein